MGSSVRATNMPELLRLLFLRVFAQLPYQVLWKWEFGPESMPDLPPNVRLERWLPQQDLLGRGPTFDLLVVRQYYDQIIENRCPAIAALRDA